MNVTTHDQTKIALVTPLRNEVNNIDKLIQSIESQTVPIYYWLVVENGSDDGSKEKLNEISNLNNVKHFEVINLELDNNEYALGRKYSSIISTGFKEIEDRIGLRNLDFLGILDSDIFPQENYYELLIKAFRADDKLGITSGLIKINNDKYDLASKSWVRGGCRLWRSSCFMQSGYLVAPSADVISAIKAKALNWKVYPIQEAIAFSRLVSTRVDYAYYAHSAYYRGHTLMYALLRSVMLLIKGYPSKSFQYIKGFLLQYFSNAERIDDPIVKKYCKMYIFNKLLRK